MACLDKASPALMKILKKLQHMEITTDIDHHLYEFGSVCYHVQASASNPRVVRLSISMPPLSPELVLPQGLPEYTHKDIERIFSDYAEVVEPSEEGYVLSLSINFNKIPHNKEDGLKAIREISSLQAIILTSQLKNMLWNIGSQETCHGMNHNPIKLVYHPREPFFIVTMPEKLTAIFPMRFKDNSDVALAASFFQELMDVGNSSSYSKAPWCTWSPIPPPELRGEHFQYLTTNGGFVSFDFRSHHVKGERADEIVWALLNFHAYVKCHVKCTRGFIQRKLRQRMASLTEVIEKTKFGREDNTVGVKRCICVGSCQCMKKMMRCSKSMALSRNCGDFANKIRRFRSRIRIKGLHRFRKCWFRIPILTSLRKYTKLE